MSGKVKAGANPFPQGRKNQDLLQRLNHLYQANTYLASLSREISRSTASVDVQCGSGGKTDKTAQRGKKRKRQDANDDVLGVAARRSNHRFKVMVKHNILATDPTLKRSFCKGCNSICIPGLNARVRVKPSRIHGNKIITTCLTCSTARTIPAPPIQAELAQSDLAALPDSSTNSAEPNPSLSAFTSVPLPNPQTSVPSSDGHPTAIRPLDGVNRSARRQKLKRKAQFWRKEAVLAGPLQTSPVHGSAVPRNASQAAVPSSALETGSTAITGPTHAENTAVSELLPGGKDIPTTDIAQRQPAPANQKQQKGQKQKGKNGGKGGNASQPVKQNGHLLWRGDDLVTGWGDLVEVQPMAPASE